MISSNEKQIRTLVVEDDALLLQMYANILHSMRMFDIVATLERGEKIIDYLFYGEIDFVVLDLLLPGVKGLDVLRLARSWGAPVDVICVSSDDSAGTITEATRLGAFDYVLKPFTIEHFQNTLNAFLAHRKLASSCTKVSCQKDVDVIFRRSRGDASSLDLPKGYQWATMDLVLGELRISGERLSASQVASRLSISRTTAARYLEYLAKAGMARSEPHYGKAGRPVLLYCSVD